MYIFYYMYIDSELSILLDYARNISFIEKRTVYPIIEAQFNSIQQGIAFALGIRPSDRTWSYSTPNNHYQCPNDCICNNTWNSLVDDRNLRDKYDLGLCQCGHEVGIHRRSDSKKPLPKKSSKEKIYRSFFNILKTEFKDIIELFRNVRNTVHDTDAVHNYVKYSYQSDTVEYSYRNNDKYKKYGDCECNEYHEREHKKCSDSCIYVYRKVEKVQITFLRLCSELNRIAKQINIYLEYENHRMIDICIITNNDLIVEEGCRLKLHKPSYSKIRFNKFQIISNNGHLWAFLYTREINDNILFNCTIYKPCELPYIVRIEDFQEIIYIERNTKICNKSVIKKESDFIFKMLSKQNPNPLELIDDSHDLLRYSKQLIDGGQLTKAYKHVSPPIDNYFRLYRNIPDKKLKDSLRNLAVGIYIEKYYDLGHNIAFVPLYIKELLSVLRIIEKKKNMIGKVINFQNDELTYEAYLTTPILRFRGDGEGYIDFIPLFRKAIDLTCISMNDLNENTVVDILYSVFTSCKLYNQYTMIKDSIDTRKYLLKKHNCSKSNMCIKKLLSLCVNLQDKLLQSIAERV